MAQETSQPAEVRTRVGQQVRVGLYGELGPDCRTVVPIIRVPFQPENGTVEGKPHVVRRPLNAPRCGGADLAAFAVLYKPAGGFSGVDKVTLDLEQGGATQRREIRVIVANPTRTRSRQPAR